MKKDGIPTSSQLDYNNQIHVILSPSKYTLQLNYADCDHFSQQSFNLMKKKKTSRHPAQICLCQHESNIMGESANTSQKTKHRPTEIKQYYSNYSIRNAHRRHGIIELNLDFLENLTIIVLYILADQKPSQKNVAVLTSPPNNDCSQHSTTSKTCFMHV